MQTTTTLIVVVLTLALFVMGNAQLQSGIEFPQGIRVSSSSSNVSCSHENDGLVAFDGESLTVCVSNGSHAEARKMLGGSEQSCASGEVLTISSSGGYECVSVSLNVSLPQCATDEVLTVAAGSSEISCARMNSVTIAAALSDCQVGLDPCTSDTAAYWRFDETGGTGLFLRDSCRSWNAEPIGSGPSVTTGYNGNAWSTPGTSDGYIRVPHDPNIILDTAFSIELFVKVHTIPSCTWGGIFSRWDFTIDNRHLSLIVRCDGALYLYVSETGTNYALVQTAVNYIITDTWMHLVGTYDGPNNVLAIYKDGVLQNTDQTGTIPLSINGGLTTEYAIGALQTRDSTFVSGPLHASYDEIRLRTTSILPPQFFISMDSTLCSPVQTESVLLLKELDNLHPPPIDNYGQLYSRRSTASTGNIDGTVFLLNGNDNPSGFNLDNGVLRDVSPSNHDIIHYENGQGGVRITGNAKVGNGALECTGRSKLRVYDNLAEFYPGNTDFTVEFFYRATPGTVTSDGIIALGVESGSNVSYETLLIYRSSSNILMYSSSTGNSWNIHSGVLVGSVETNVWHHYAISKQGLTWRTFRDGIVQATTTPSSEPYDTTGSANAVLEIMGRPSHTSSTKYADMDELRISRGIARYVSNFSPPTSELAVDQYTILMVRFDMPFLDSSNSRPFYCSGATDNTASNPMYSSPTAFHFDGSSRYINLVSRNPETGNDDDFDLAMSDFTIEMWTYAASYDQDAAILSTRRYASFEGILCKIEARTFVCYMTTSGSTWDVQIRSSAVTADSQWNHFAVTRRITSSTGSSETSTYTLYINGAVEATQSLTSTSGVLIEKSGGIRLGVDFYSVSRIIHYTGYLDDVRIIKGNAIYTGSFTPPQPFTGTSLEPSLYYLTSGGVEYLLGGDGGASSSSGESQWSSVGNTVSWGGRVAVGLSSLQDVIDFDEEANHTMTVNGTIESGGVFLSSDARLKTSVEPISGALDIVSSLQGHRYVWKNRAGIPGKLQGNVEASDESQQQLGDKDIGFIAQEVENILPELVQTGRNGYKAVAYDKVTPVLVEALKELQQKTDERFDDMQRVIDEQARVIEELKAKLSK